MEWSVRHLLAGIALLVALFGGGVMWFPGVEPRVASVGLVLAVLLLCVALLVS